MLSLGEEFLIDEGTRGYHGCYYCTPDAFPKPTGYGSASGNPDRDLPWDNRPQSPLSKGHHLVRLGDVVYMCPALLPHYVVAHGYRPPDAFQDAVLSGTFLANDDLLDTGEDFREFALQRSLAAAEATGDTARADGYRARIDARRKELRLAGRTSGYRDRDTGVWRDDPAAAVSSPKTSSERRLERPALWPFDRVLLDQPDAATGSGTIARLRAWLRRKWKG